MKWYTSLSIHQKISLKGCCKMIVGVSWEDLSMLFSFTDIIELLHNKLDMEGFEV